MEIKTYRLAGYELYVEAVYLHPRDTNPDEVARWCGGEVVIRPEEMSFIWGPLVVRFTDECGDESTVGAGEYLVKGPEGFFKRPKDYFERLYDPIDIPEAEKEEESPTRLPSRIWEELFGLTILDPDGWDRRNFTESWGEYITEKEFIRRAGPSTMGMRNNLTEPPVLRRFWDVLPHA